jgi:hypothetical protein
MRVRTKRIANGKFSDAMAVSSQHDSVWCGLGAVRECEAGLANMPALAVDVPADTFRDMNRWLDDDWQGPVGSESVRDRVGRGLLKSSGDCQAVFFALVGVVYLHGLDLRFASGQRTGLVENHMRGPGQYFDGVAIGDEEL